MVKDFSFREVEKFVKKDTPEIIEQFDQLVTLILLFSVPYIIIPKTAVEKIFGLLDNLFGIKNEFSKITKYIFKKITEKKDKDSLTKLQRMEAAYYLICYTAFFEALEKFLPDITKLAKLTGKEKFQLSKSAAEQTNTTVNKKADAFPQFPQSEILDTNLCLPHPIDSFDAQKEQLLPIYKELTKGFLSFLECLAIWELLDDRQKNEIKRVLNTLPEHCWKYFQSQYYVLATRYEEFFIWSNLHENKEIKTNIRDLSNYIQKHIALEQASQKKIDIGFTTLAKVLAHIPDEVDAIQADRTLSELEKLYRSVVEEPVIKDTHVAEREKVTLTFPKKSEIFVPQSFKAIRYSGKEQLENESVWREKPIRNDLGTFLLSYFSSPYSTLTPLIILGHPGSGKSLLTNILSARLISPLYTPIRVELRDVNADTSITAQIEEQIYKNTTRRVSWADLTDRFRNKPALVLLDGYDELLQASGKVFSGYLLDVQKFQQNETAIGREPVRTIVTSRITLIDKAEIPIGATVIRLLEFDSEKRQKWISVWNSANRQYFKQNDIKPFEIAEDNSKMVSLAKQPLLLLMLALYDSEDNELRKQKELDQTVLYDRLLRRFIERERKKDNDFLSINKKEQVSEIDRDMQRLGVAAIGMFNRRTLHITTSQLNIDLFFFNLERVIEDTGGRKLSQADLLLGSFFFVHESQSIHKNDNPQERGIKSAFEFLHNTFGEFLTADFTFRKVLDQAHSLYQLKINEDFKGVLEHKLTVPDTFPKDFYGCLMYTPLFSRPVILDMMREWLPHLLNQKRININNFLEGLDIIIEHQINRLLTTNILPSIMTERESPFVCLPTLGYLAIYSLNLILLRTLLSPDGYIFDEEPISVYEEGARAWDRLIHLWRSWFPI
ncbi:MAG: ATP-binding protein, partial [Bacteroidetes bacterium]|nr:ATP-binding protein [Bacteroidota bacterium]